jgi:tripartite-type tricarboxylate transporter receptor subunit TctC
MSTRDQAARPQTEAEPKPDACGAGDAGGAGTPARPAARRTLLLGVAGAAAVGAGIGWGPWVRRASAQGSDAPGYPTKPIQMIVTVSAGGSIDQIGRLIAPIMADALGQPVVVENRPGANGNIAAGHVARADADGHTLLLTGGSTPTLNPHLFRKLPFDPLKDFAPISMTARTNLILVVHPKLEVDTVDAFVALAKERPGQMNFGSAGNGSLMHLGTGLFNQIAGIDTRHVPYRGLAPAVTDLLAGQIEFMFDSATTLQHIADGKLKALGVVGPNEVPALPKVRTLEALGYPGMDVMSGWHGLFAPSGTPPAIVARLNAEANKALATDEVRARIVAMGAEPALSTPDELGRILARDIERLGPLVRQSGVVLG